MPMNILFFIMVVNKILGEPHLNIPPQLLIVNVLQGLVVTLGIQLHQSGIHEELCVLKHHGPIVVWVLHGEEFDPCQLIST